MRIALAPRDYRGVALRLVGFDDYGFLYEICLVHADADLGFGLARCRDQAEAASAWSLWARFLALPTLVERAEGVFEPSRPGFGSAMARPPESRRRGRAPLARRARFLTRRKIGRSELCVRVAATIELSGWHR